MPAANQASWEHQIEILPIFRRGGAIDSPVGRIVQMIGNLRRPIATHETVVDVALDGLAESGGAARRVHFPTGSEHQRASHRDVRALRIRWPALQCLDITETGGLIGTVDAGRLFVYRSHVFHDAFLSAVIAARAPRWG